MTHPVWNEISVQSPGSVLVLYKLIYTTLKSTLNQKINPTPQKTPDYLMQVWNY